MSTTSIGRQAEKAVAEYLERKYGFKILSLNWRTRYCEIDIVAESSSGIIKKIKTIHFIEVKYRRSNAQGGGLEAVTKKKLEQMQRSAEIWTHENSWSHDYQLDVVSVSGQPNEWIFDVRFNVYL